MWLLGHTHGQLTQELSSHFINKDKDQIAIQCFVQGHTLKCGRASWDANSFSVTLHFLLYVIDAEALLRIKLFYLYMISDLMFGYLKWVLVYFLSQKNFCRVSNMLVQQNLRRCISLGFSGPERVHNLLCSSVFTNCHQEIFYST